MNCLELTSFGMYAEKVPVISRSELVGIGARVDTLQTLLIVVVLRLPTGFVFDILDCYVVPLLTDPNMSMQCSGNT